MLTMGDRNLLHNSQTTPTWANYLTFLSISLFICKIGLIKDQPYRVAGEGREKNQCREESEIHTRVCLNFSQRTGKWEPSGVREWSQWSGLRTANR